MDSVLFFHTQPIFAAKTLTKGVDREESEKMVIGREIKQALTDYEFHVHPQLKKKKKLIFP